MAAFVACKKTPEFLKSLVIFLEKIQRRRGFSFKGFSHLKKDVHVPVTLTGWMSFIPTIL